MACSIIYWGNNFEKFYDEFIKFGAVVDLTPLQNEAIGKEKSIMKLKFG